MASLALPTSTTERKPSPPTKGIGFEVWSEVQRRRSKDVTHASFMVDGLELMLLGITGLIGWILVGPTLAPKPLPGGGGSGGGPYVPAPPPTCGEMKAAYDAFRAQGDSGSASRVLRDAEAEGCPWATFQPALPTARIPGSGSGGGSFAPMSLALTAGTTTPAAPPPAGPAPAPTAPTVRAGGSAIVV